MRLAHGDAFAGIGGFGLAARRVGWLTVWACEIERSARAVYSARLARPELRFDNDIRQARDLPHIDVLTGGFPCQDLSIAGRRQGLAGARSGLFFELVRLLRESRPQWFVFENVPGLLSSRRGEDMALVLDSLVECGYGVAYRILDAQHFGVPQRRRRLFLIGHSSGEWQRPAAVLFERASGERDSRPRRASRPDLAATVGSNTGGYRTTDVERTCIVQQAISAKWAKGSSGPAGDEYHNLVIDGEAAHADRMREVAGASRSLDVCPVCEDGPDSFRYRGIGNGVAVPVAEWIFRRIDDATR